MKTTLILDDRVLDRLGLVSLVAGGVGIEFTDFDEAAREHQGESRFVRAYSTRGLAGLAERRQMNTEPASRRQLDRVRAIGEYGEDGARTDPWNIQPTVFVDDLHRTQDP